VHIGMYTNEVTLLERLPICCPFLTSLQIVSIRFVLQIGNLGGLKKGEPRPTISPFVRKGSHLVLVYFCEMFFQTYNLQNV
jgi:hypothetical protein